MRKLVEPFLHSLFWILLASLAYTNFGVKLVMLKGDTGVAKEFIYRNDNIVVILTIDIAFKIILFYLSCFKYLPEYLSSKKLVNGLKLIGLMLVTSGASLFIGYWLFDPDSNYSIPQPWFLVLYSSLFHFIIMLLSIGYGLLKDKLISENLQQQLEKEKLNTELNFLKSQINPHFLFNTLNNLYAEAHKHDNKTLSNGISKMSQMMRYMIYDSNVEMVKLNKEVEYLRSYVELQMLRISPHDLFDLNMEIPKLDDNIMIAPIIFQPLVENAFKHGIELEGKSFIHIKLQLLQNQIVFNVVNSKSRDSRLLETSGIGLSNTKRRLELIYPDKHILEVEESEKQFSIALAIDL